MRGVHGLMDTLNLADLLAFAVPGGLFSISQTTKLFAVSLSDAGTVKVFSQLKIIITGVFAGTVLGQRFSLTQWQTMILLLTLLVAFAVASDSAGAGNHQKLHLAFLFATLFSFFGCMASLLDEKLLKASTLPFYSQRTQLDLMGLPWAVLMLFAVPAYTDDDDDRYWACGDDCAFPFFHHWCGATVFALCCNTGQAWLSGFLVKHLSTVTKNIASAAAFVVTFFLSGILKAHDQGKTYELKIEVAILAGAILQTALLYAQLPKLPKPDIEVVREQELVNTENFGSKSS